MEEVRYEPDEVIEEGDAVIVALRLVGRGAASGIEVELKAATVNWVENGKVKRIEVYPNVETARASLR